MLYPLQNDSIFSSLYPGTYTVRVHDVNSYDSAQANFTITGTYHQLNFTLQPVAPLCGGGYNSAIIVNSNGTGLSPYIYQIISPFAGTPQGNDTLDQLEAGNYTVKVTDACDIALTKSVVVDSGGSGLRTLSYAFEFVGCDTVLLSDEFYLDTAFQKYPLKFTIITATDTIIKYEIPQAYGVGVSLVTDTLYNVGFGSALSVCVTDICGYTLCLPGNQLGNFAYNIQYSEQVGNCSISYGADVVPASNNNGHLATSTFLLPIIVTLTDSATGMVVDSFTGNANGGWHLVPPQTNGQTYLVRLRDQCGDTFQLWAHWPVPPASAKSFGAGDSNLGSCPDSTGIGSFAWSGLSSSLTIQLLSGPASAHSTKPGFGYYDTIIYPVVYTDVNMDGAWYISAMPLGTYTYRAWDACGDTFTGSFAIGVVSSLAFQPSLTLTCGGLSTLSVFLGNGNTVCMSYLTGHNYSQGYTEPGEELDFFSLSPGLYNLQISFYNEYENTALVGPISCPLMSDSINVIPTSDTLLKATDVATCNGVIYLQLEPDSTNGILPFQYEIISGPETYAPQMSNLFTVNNYGTYLVGVIDSCGDVDTRQVSVDTGKFTPISRSGGWCAGSRVQLAETASPFLTYLWRRPDGTLFTGDTLVIDNLTEADTGVYQVTQTVSINGCRDSTMGSYHLVIKDTFQQSVALCTGDTLYVGPYAHTASGLYRDTLTGTGGCDSIVVSDLAVFSASHVVITPSQPPVCHTGPVTLVATGGNTYTWSPGNYQTDTIAVSPQVMTVYTVIANEATSCSSSASVSVYPPSDSTVALTQNKNIICPTDSSEICAPAGYSTYQWNPGVTGTGDCVQAYAAGNYYVTVTNAYGCTAASNRLSVSVYPEPSVSIVVQGDTLTSFGQKQYQWLFNDVPLTGDTGTEYVSHQAGYYSVQVTDTNGCTTTSKTVLVTGVQDLAKGEEVLIYPNPNSVGNWQLTVGNELIGAKLEVYDEQGRLVFNSKLKTQNSKLELNIPAGVYYLRISNAAGSVVRKLVKM